MARNAIVWPKAMRDKAKAEGKALFAVGYDGKAGRMQLWGPRDERQALCSLWMATHLHLGKTLDESLAETKAQLAEYDAKQAEKKPEASPDE